MLCNSALDHASSTVPSVNIDELVVVAAVDMGDLCHSVRVKEKCFNVTTLCDNNITPNCEVSVSGE